MSQDKGPVKRRGPDSGGFLDSRRPMISILVTLVTFAAEFSARRIILAIAGISLIATPSGGMPGMRVNQTARPRFRSSSMRERFRVPHNTSSSRSARAPQTGCRAPYT